MKPIIGITMGDAAGVGPEIIVKALGHREVYEQCRPVVLGDAKIMNRALSVTGSDLMLGSVHSIQECGSNRERSIVWIRTCCRRICPSASCRRLREMQRSSS
ncbi:hypothetical protein HMSSN036_80500 [Paenibacillus macerans]|nr:hypothetical protein HMSSN036_80500 [Paenibacillus macerans]